MLQSISEELRGLSIFANMEKPSFETLIGGAYVQDFPPHVDLITEGGTPDFLHIVLSGAVDLFSNWNDRETSLATVRPVSTFILAATIRNAPFLMSARTLQKSRIALLPSADVRTIFDSDRAFARAIVDELAVCYRVMVKSTKNLKLRTSLERVANYLLRARDRQSSSEFQLDMEKRRLASFLGMSPENLSRAFKKLEEHGVKVKGNWVLISDPESLAEFAQPHPLIDDYGT